MLEQTHVSADVWGTFVELHGILHASGRAILRWSGILGLLQGVVAGSLQTYSMCIIYIYIAAF